MRNSIIAAILLSASAVISSEQKPVSIEQAVLKTGADIESATRDLNSLRDRIALERKPLADSYESLMAEVSSLRSKVALVRSIKGRNAAELMDLESDVRSLREEREFMFSILSEYRRSLETRITRAETLRQAGTLAGIDVLLDGADEPASLVEVFEKLFTVAAETAEERIGGCVFSGTALDGGGVEHDGRFAVIGPLSYFSADDSSVAGMTVTRLGSSYESIYDEQAEAGKVAVCSLVSGAAADVSVDVSAGDALKVKEAQPTVLEHMGKGGFVMIPLMVIGAVALVLICSKLVGIRRLTVFSNEGIDRVLKQLADGDVEGARTTASGLGEPLSEIILEGIRHRDATREQIEEILHEHILARVPLFEKHLGALAVLGAVSPLLGLLGTVTGMIHTFRLVTVFGSGDARLLSGGISEALVTTEFGLIIAIPVLLVHAYFSRRVRSMIGVLEYTVVDFVNNLKFGNHE